MGTPTREETISTAQPVSDTDDSASSASTDNSIVEVSNPRKDESAESSEDEVVKPPEPERNQPNSRFLIVFFEWLRWIWKHPEDTKDKRFSDKTFEIVNSYPQGYPRLAAWHSSDENFRIYKRFGRLRNRVILTRQGELASLEQQLDDLDNEDDVAKNYRTRSLLERKDSPRVKLIAEIDTKLREYDQLLQREHQSMLMQKPQSRDYRNLVNYFYNTKPVIVDEMDFLRHRNDFVLLGHPAEAPLEGMLDWLVCRIPVRWVRKQFSSASQVNNLGRHMLLPSHRKMYYLARLIASVLAIGLISVPLVVLATESLGQSTKILVLLGSLITFPIVLQLTARPKNLELFIGTATYCAVLSALIANSPGFAMSDLQAQLGFLSQTGNGTISS